MADNNTYRSKYSGEQIDATVQLAIDNRKNIQNVAERIGDAEKIAADNKKDIQNINNNVADLKEYMEYASSESDIVKYYGEAGIIPSDSNLFNYTLNDDEQSYTITRNENSLSGDIVIPYEYDGLPITAIGDYGVYFAPHVISITIPNSVTSIGENAFTDCIGLINITIPDSVISIGHSAFADCPNLKSIIIPDGVTSICNSVFGFCSGLSSITIPDGVTSVDDGAFTGCSGLTNITIPDSITFIGDEAFHGCISLNNIYYKGTKEQWDAIEIQGEYNEALFTATIHYDWTPAMNGEVDEKLAKHIDNAVTNSIKYYGEAGIVPSSQDLFGFAIDTTNKTATVQRQTGVDPFDYSPLSGDIVIPYEYTIESGENVGVYKVTKIDYFAFSYAVNVTSFTLPNTILEIGSSAFCGCENAAINIPDSVTSIGEEAFRECYNLKTVDIPKNISTIHFRTFLGSDFTSVTIPLSLTNIKAQAFEGCGLLTDVYYEGAKEQWNNINVEDYNESLLNATIHYGCVPATQGYVDEKIANVVINSGGSGGSNVVVDSALSATSENPVQNKIITAKVNEIQEDLEATQTTSDKNSQRISSLKYYGDSSLVPSDKNMFTFELNTGGNAAAIKKVENAIGEVVVPYECDINGVIYPVTTISDGSFMNLTKVTSVIIPNTVTIIKTGAFQGCSALTSVMLPDTLTTLGGYAFSDCINLKNIVIPNRIPTINSKTFYSCSNLSSITIPVSVTKIDHNAVQASNNLKDIYYAGTKAQWEAINIGDNAIIDRATKHYGVAPAKVSDMQELIDEINTLRETINLLYAKSLVKTVEISLPSSGWVGEGNNYSQVVTIADVTQYSKIDLQPTPEQLVIFYEKDVTFVAENDNKVVTIYCIGQKPMNDYVIQATITEVI